MNKATARAALTQMLSAVNQRMEKTDIQLKAQVDEGNASTDWAASNPSQR